MPGGARAHSGPPPDPAALRRDRNDDAGWIHLPAAGRLGDPPPWPLTRPTAREMQLWAQEWARPQAIMWERNGQALEVAMYVRTVKDAERAKASVAARTLVRQQQETLGISLPGLHRNRWIIDQEQAPAGQRVAAARSSDVRARLKVVANA